MKTSYSFNRKMLARLSLAALFSGCASLSGNLAASETLEVERVDSRDARIAHVYVQPSDSGMRINGYLRKSFLRRGHIPGHLHIKVIGNNGETLAQTTNRYHRRRAKSQRSFFSAIVPVQVSDAAKIQVTHHGLSDKSC